MLKSISFSLVRCKLCLWKPTTGATQQSHMQTCRSSRKEPIMKTMIVMILALRENSWSGGPNFGQHRFCFPSCPIWFYGSTKELLIKLKTRTRDHRSGHAQQYGVRLCGTLCSESLCLIKTQMSHENTPIPLSRIGLKLRLAQFPTSFLQPPAALVVSLATCHQHGGYFSGEQGWPCMIWLPVWFKNLHGCSAP